MDHLLSEFLESDRVGQRFTAGLEGERFVDIPYRVSLSVDRTQADAPVVGVCLRQLRNVTRHLQSSINMNHPYFYMLGLWTQTLVHACYIILIRINKTSQIKD